MDRGRRALVLAAFMANGSLWAFHKTFGDSPTIRYLSGDVGLAYFLDQGNMHKGLIPNNDCLYSLTEMAVMQKLPLGYLITVDSSFVDPNGNGTGTAFLYTDKHYVASQILENYGYYVGKYKFRDLSGNDRTVMAFREYTGYAKSFPFLNCLGVSR